ncbi:gliding motility lipoprotein GldH [Aurantibacter sp.]|uniref:gliding motility lipoprotein GldH n=1 Tax=Aurantibacter sp. TaxID=2807103 RepID=UPI003266646E
MRTKKEEIIKTGSQETRKLLVVGILLLLVFSCNTATVKTEYKSTENGTWLKDSIVQFTFSELDSTARYNMFINVRNDQTFAYNNLFLIAEMNFPSGESVRDTLEYEMAMPDGTWLGKGYGSIKENKLWYKENIVFPTSGVYTLQLSHAMRTNGAVEGVVSLKGITDVGFEIEKSILK